MLDVMQMLALLLITQIVSITSEVPIIATPVNSPLAKSFWHESEVLVQMNQVSTGWMCSVDEFD